ncbi:MAG: hypothetical protein V4570_09520 [Pseudomonadota bacterium]
MHIGDPSIAGWLILLAYLAVVCRCYLQYTQAKTELVDPYFWLVVGGFVLLLGINKQLDLQTVFEVGMKDLAKSNGWYAQRRIMQTAFVTMLGIGLLTILIMLRGMLAKSCRNHKTVCLGVLLLCVFIVLRAGAFNHLSFLDTQSYWGFNAHALLELTALCVIFYGARLSKYTHKKTSTQPVAFAFCANNGDNVYCPYCSMQAAAKAAEGRQFKCKACEAMYTVRIR